MVQGPLSSNLLSNRTQDTSMGPTITVTIGKVAYKCGIWGVSIAESQLKKKCNN